MKNTENFIEFFFFCGRLPNAPPQTMFHHCPRRPNLCYLIIILPPRLESAFLSRSPHLVFLTHAANLLSFRCLCFVIGNKETTKCFRKSSVDYVIIFSVRRSGKRIATNPTNNLTTWVDQKLISFSRSLPSDYLNSLELWGSASAS